MHAHMCDAFAGPFATMRALQIGILLLTGMQGGR